MDVYLNCVCSVVAAESDVKEFGGLPQVSKARTDVGLEIVPTKRKVSKFTYFPTEIKD